MRETACTFSLYLIKIINNKKKEKTTTFITFSFRIPPSFYFRIVFFPYRFRQSALPVLPRNPFFLRKGTDRVEKPSCRTWQPCARLRRNGRSLSKVRHLLVMRSTGFLCQVLLQKSRVHSAVRFVCINLPFFLGPNRILFPKSKFVQKILGRESKPNHVLTHLKAVMYATDETIIIHWRYEFQKV